MKSESQIAKENIKAIEILKKGSEKIRAISVSFAVQHEETCQRWLEFLEKMHFEKLCIAVSGKWFDKYVRKEKDLRRAIKIYDDNGI